MNSDAPKRVWVEWEPKSADEQQQRAWQTLKIHGVYRCHSQGEAFDGGVEYIRADVVNKMIDEAVNDALRSTPGTEWSV